MRVSVRGSLGRDFGLIPLLVGLGLAQTSSIPPDNISSSPCQCIETISARPKAAAVALVWKHDGSAEYQVFRSTVSAKSGFERIASVVSTYSTYIDNAVLLNQNYYYRVQSANGCLSYVVSVVPRARSTNRAPSITSQPITSGRSGEGYGYRVQAIDPDGNTPKFHLDEAPPGMTLDSLDGRISWHPGAGEIGDHCVTVRVTDGFLSAVQPFVISVQLPPNEAPRANAGSDLSVSLPSPAFLQGSVSDDGLPNPPGKVEVAWSNAAGPGTVSFADSNSLVTTATFDSPGTYQLELSVNDGELESSDSLEVVVNPASCEGLDDGDPCTKDSCDIRKGVLRFPIRTQTFHKRDSGRCIWDGFDGSALRTEWNPGGVGGTPPFSVSQSKLGITDADFAVMPLHPNQSWIWDLDVDLGNQITRPAPVGFSDFDMEFEFEWETDVPGEMQAGVALTNSLNQMEVRAGVWDGHPVPPTGNGYDFIAVRQPPADPKPGGNELYWTGGIPPTSATGKSRFRLMRRDGKLSIWHNGVLSLDSVDFVRDIRNLAIFTVRGRVDGATYDFGTFLLHDVSLCWWDRVVREDSLCPVRNVPPVAFAGRDTAIPFQTEALLQGNVEDDGLPTSGKLSFLWSKVSGPGQVTFGNASGLATIAEFGAPGTYVVRLIATDSELSDSDEVEVIVTAPQDSCLAISSGLESWWPGDGTYADAIGSNHGFGPTVPAFGPGRRGQAMHFDGTGQLVSVPHHASLVHRDSFSIELWFQPAQDIIPSDQAAPIFLAKGFEHSLGIANASIINGTPQGEFEVRGPIPRPFSTTHFWAAGRWYHAVVTYHQSEYRVYINGTLEGNSSSLTSVLGGLEVLHFGGFPGQPQTYFRGMVDDIRIYSRALGEVDIQRLYMGTEQCPTLNQPPIARAGDDDTVLISGMANLAGFVEDDGLPQPPGRLAFSWSRVTGPGEILFDQPDSLRTRAAFSEAGTYQVALRATDGESESSDTVRIVAHAACSHPSALSISAGRDILASREKFLRGGNLQVQFDWPTFFSEAQYQHGSLGPSFSRSSLSTSLPGGVTNTISALPGSSLNISNWKDGGQYDGPGGIAAADLAINGVENFRMDFGRPLRTLGFSISSGSGNDPTQFDRNGAAFRYTIRDVQGNAIGTGEHALSEDISDEAWISIASSTPFSSLEVVEIGNSAITDQYFSNFISNDCQPLRPCASPLPDAVSWWAADGNPADRMAVNPGVLRNGAGFGPGRIREAFNLDGVNDYVEIADHPTLTPTSITVTAWIRAENLSGHRTIAAKYNSAIGPHGVSWVLENEPEPTSTGTSVSGHIQFHIRNDPLLYRAVSTSQELLQEGRWHHVAATFDQATQEIAIYVDGLRATSVRRFLGPSHQEVSLDEWNAAPSIRMNDSPSPMYIGVLGSPIRPEGLVGFWDGQIDELEIFSRALLPHEVRALYEAPDKCLPENQSPLVDAGPDMEFPSGIPVTMSGRALDDGLPIGSQIDISWSKISGSGNVAFANSNSPITEASFDVPGTYLLRLRASDGTIETTDDVAVTAGAPCKLDSSSLLSLWSLEGSLVDRNGQNSGSPRESPGFGPAIVGLGLQLAGNGYAEIPDHPSQSPTSLTVEAWARTETHQSTVIIGKYNSSLGASGVNWFLQTEPIPGHTTGTALSFGIYGQGGSLRRLVTDQPLIQLNRWHHLSASFDHARQRMCLFVDGRRVADSTLTGPAFSIQDGISSAYIGGYIAGSGNAAGLWRGGIDEVALHDRALSVDEIHRAWLAGTNGRCPISEICRLPDGLVGWWAGDGNAADRTSMNQALPRNGASFGQGFVRSAFQLDGIDDYLEIADSPDFSLNSITVEGWVRPDNLFGARSIIGKYNSNLGGRGVSWGFRNNPFPSPTSIHSGHLWFSVYDSTTYPYFRGVSTRDEVIEVGRWHHVAANFNDETQDIAIYVDGKPVTRLRRWLGGEGFTSREVDSIEWKAALPVRITDSPTPIFLGAATNSEAQIASVWQGSLDEMDVFNRSLSADEIHSIYLAGANGKCLPSNRLPTVVAGIDVSAPMGFRVNLSGRVLDDGLPLEGELNIGWTKVSGPGDVAFGNSSAPETDAEFSATGRYVLRLEASDGSGTVSDEILVTAGSECHPPPPGIAGWWRLDGDGSDRISSNHGTEVGQVAFGPGVVGQGLELSGNGHVEVPDHPSQSPASITLEAWVRPDFAEDGSIIGKYNSSLGLQGQNWGLSTRRRVGNLSGLDIMFSLYGMGGAYREMTTLQPVVARGLWNHVAATFDHETQRLAIYVNGSEVSSSLLSEGDVMALKDGTSPIYIGTSVGSNGAYAVSMRGGIDESAIYGRALSPLEVKESWLAGANGKCLLDTPPPVTRNDSFNIEPRILELPDGLTARYLANNKLGEGSGTVFDGDRTLFITDLKTRSGDALVYKLDVPTRDLRVLRAGLPIAFPRQALIGDGRNPLGRDLIIADWNSEETQLCCSGRIFALNRETGAIRAIFAPPSNRNPYDMDLAPASFGGGLMIVDSWVGSEEPILFQVGVDGSSSVFFRNPAVWNSSRNIHSLAFGKGFGYGEELYLSDGPGIVWKLTADKNASQFVSNGLGNAGPLTFSKGGIFGNSLYVINEIPNSRLIHSISPTGELTLFASGIPQGGHSDLSFSEDGTRLFLVSNLSVYEISAGVTPWILAPGLLSNDESPLGLPLSASLISAPKNGTLVLEGDGSFLYKPNAGFLGRDTFTYVAGDGTQNSNVATVSLNVDFQNEPPGVWAGRDTSIAEDDTLTLTGKAGDDGLPSPPGVLAVTWSKLSGPGEISFGTSNAATTSAFFSHSGDYQLLLTASDFQLSNSDTVTITVNPSIDTNHPPTLSAGPDQTISLPSSAILGGSATDDGLPNPPGSVALVWRKEAGPGEVAFSDSTVATPTASFSATGTYRVRLVASDGELVASDEVTITVVNTLIELDFSDGLLPSSKGWEFESDCQGSVPGGKNLAENQVATVANGRLFLDTRGQGSMGVDGYYLRPTPMDSNSGFLFETSLRVNALDLQQPPEVDQAFAFNVVAAKLLFLAQIGLDNVRGLDAGSSYDFNLLVRTNTTDFHTYGLKRYGNSNLMTLYIDGTPVLTAPGEPIVYRDQIIFGDATCQSRNGSVEINWVRFSEIPPAGTYLNQIPVANAGPDLLTSNGSLVNLAGRATDDGLPSGTALTVFWSKIDGPGEVTFDSVYSANTTAGFSAPGVYLLRLTAHDSELVGWDHVTVTVTSGNTSPSVNAGPDQSITLPATANLQGTATDDGLPSGSSLSIQWHQLDGSGVAAFGNTTQSTTTASFSAPGSYRLILRGFDGELATEDTVAITVFPAPVNLPPVVSAGPDRDIMLPCATLQGMVIDDGLPAPPDLFVLWNCAAGVQLENSSNPTTHACFETEAIYPCELIVYDGEYEVRDTVHLTTSLNRAPVVQAGPDRILMLPDSLVLTASSADDGLPNPPGTLAYQWLPVSGPAPIHFTAPTGTSTRAVFSEPGAYVLGFLASDGLLSDTDFVSVTVRPFRANQPPQVFAGNDQEIQLPAFTTLSGIAQDDSLPNGPGTLTYAWSRISGPGTVQFSQAGSPTTQVVFSAAGVHTLRLEVQDGALTAADTLAVTVFMAPDGAVPVAALSFPAETTLTTFTQPESVQGTAYDTDLLDYSLWVCKPDGSGCALHFTAVTPVQAGALGTFDPTLLPNGIYQLQLRVRDLARQVNTAFAMVVVEGGMKLGQLNFAKTDLSLKALGMDLALVREYDSRRTDGGDFGPGWHLAHKSVQAASTVEVLGQNWIEFITFDPNCRFACLPIYKYRSERIHSLVVRLSDTEVERFRMDLNPNQQSAAPLSQSQAIFVAEGNTLSRLEAIDASPSVKISGSESVELLDLENDEVWNPRRFRLTRRDGTVYIVNTSTGLESMTDVNGHTVTYGENGIQHSSGAGITFTRGEGNRIVQATDNEGRTMEYQYQDGVLTRVVQIRDKGQATNNILENYAFMPASLKRRLKEIRAPDGRVLGSFEYDGTGRLVGLIDANGNPVVYGYDLPSQRQCVTDRLNQETCYEYDNRGNVTSKRDPTGATWTYFYDAKDNDTLEIGPTGVRIRKSYNAAGDMTSETDGLGNTTAYVYDPDGRVTRTEDPLGRVTRNSYDDKGNLDTTMDAMGRITAYAYDAAGNQTRMVDAAGNVITYAYDASGNMTRQADALGQVMTFDYDAYGNQVQETRFRIVNGDTVPVTSRNVFDAQNRLVKTYDPNGDSTFTEYDALGKQTASVDKLGRRTEFTYDAQGNQVKVTYPDGSSDSTVYDPEGRRVASFDRVDRRTRFEYDVLGRLVRTIFSDNTTTSTVYDALGRTVSTTDVAGSVTTFEYEHGCGCSNRRTAVRDAVGKVTLFEYDTVGNQAAVIDANGNRTTFVYDALNRRIKTLYADGSSDSTGYDALGRNVLKRDQAGVVTRYEYDVLGRLVKVIDALNQETRYGYDEMGNQITQTDALGRVTRFEYDNLGRRTRRILPLGQAETFAYNEAGSMLSKTDFNGRTTIFDYDVLGRLIRKTPDPFFAGHPGISFTYTASGQRATMADASGNTQYQYDDRDRLTRKATPQGTLIYGYDGVGRLASIRSEADSGVSVEYAYDALGRLRESRDNRLTNGVTSYAYDSAGNLAAYAYPNGVTHRYAYNALNRLTRLDVDGPAAPLARYIYALGPTGNRLSVADLSGRLVEYTYDNLYRLAAETISGDAAPNLNGVIDYTYDVVGNRQERTSTVGPVAPATYAYNANDQLLSDTYDANGNTVGSGGKNFAWDFENRLVGMDSGDVHVTMVYDGDGNRVRKTVGGVTTEFLVDDRNLTGYAQVLEERQGEEVTSLYTYGLDLISQRQVVGVGGEWESQFFGYDGHGNSTSLINEGGEGALNWAFDAFGIQLRSQHESNPSYLFMGELYESELDLYYLRARFFDYRTGVFKSMDSEEGMNIDPFSQHKYVFGNNNPITHLDPSGLFSISESAVTAAVIGYLATSAYSVKYPKGVIGKAYSRVGEALPDAVILGAAGVISSRFLALANYLGIVVPTQILASVANGINVNVGGSIEMIVNVASGETESFFSPMGGLSTATNAQGSLSVYSGIIYNLYNTGHYKGTTLNGGIGLAKSDFNFLLGGINNSCGSYYGATIGKSVSFGGVSNFVPSGSLSYGYQWPGSYKPFQSVFGTIPDLARVSVGFGAILGSRFGANAGMLSGASMMNLPLYKNKTATELLDRQSNQCP